MCTLETFLAALENSAVAPVEGCKAPLPRYRLSPLSSLLVLLQILSCKCLFYTCFPRAPSFLPSLPILFSSFPQTCLSDHTRCKSGDGGQPTTSWQSWSAPSFTQTLLSSFSPVEPMPKFALMQIVDCLHEYWEQCGRCSRRLSSSGLHWHKRVKTRASQKHKLLTDSIGLLGNHLLRAITTNYLTELEKQKNNLWRVLGTHYCVIMGFYKIGKKYQALNVSV